MIITAPKGTVVEIENGKTREESNKVIIKSEDQPMNIF